MHTQTTKQHKNQHIQCTIGVTHASRSAALNGPDGFTMYNYIVLRWMFITFILLNNVHANCHYYQSSFNNTAYTTFRVTWSGLLLNLIK